MVHGDFLQKTAESFLAINKQYEVDNQCLKCIEDKFVCNFVDSKTRHGARICGKRAKGVELWYGFASALKISLARLPIEGTIALAFAVEEFGMSVIGCELDIVYINLKTFRSRNDIRQVGLEVLHERLYS